MLFIRIPVIEMLLVLIVSCLAVSIIQVDVVESFEVYFGCRGTVNRSEELSFKGRSILLDNQKVVLYEFECLERCLGNPKCYGASYKKGDKDTPSVCTMYNDAILTLPLVKSGAGSVLLQLNCSCRGNVTRIVGKSILGNARKVYHGSDDFGNSIGTEQDCIRSCRSEPTCTGATFTNEVYLSPQKRRPECILHDIDGPLIEGPKLAKSVYLKLDCGVSNIPTTSIADNAIDCII